MFRFFLFSITVVLSEKFSASLDDIHASLDASLASLDAIDAGLEASFASLDDVSSNSIELHPKNWIKVTGGKTLFVKFCYTFLPSCKMLHSTWENLAGPFKDHPDILIGHINCDKQGKPICKKFHASISRPEIRYGHAENLKKIDMNEPNFRQLQTLVSELKLICSIQNVKGCSDEERKKILNLASLPIQALTSKLVKYHQAQKQTIETFKDDSFALKQQYYALEEQHQQNLDQLHGTHDVHLIQDVLSKLVGEVEPELLVTNEFKNEL